MGEISARISELMRAKELSYGRLSELTGIPKSGIYRYANEPNDKIPLPKLEMIAKALNVTTAYLMGWENYQAVQIPDNMLPLPKMKEWPVLGATACGTPLHRETYDETVMAPEDIKADVVFRCVGDSMINARIFDGDAVFIRLQPSVDNGQIAVVRLDDEYTLKRVYMGDGYVELRAENPTFPTIILRGAELEAKNFAVIGLAVTFLSHVR